MLIDLLIVIAILGIVGSLLLPAVQSAREAARRLTCVNNLRQFGTAIHGYESAHNTFPSGYVSSYPEDVANRERSAWSWGALILPFLEQEALYNQLQVNRRSLAENLATPTGMSALQTPLSLFFCPVDIGPELNDFTEAYLTNQWRHEAAPYRRLVTSDGTDRLAIAKSNYVGVACSSITLFTLVDPTMFGSATGVLYQNSATRFSDITDGASYTLMIGERSFSIGPNAYNGAHGIGPLTIGAANALGFSPEVGSPDREGPPTAAIGIPYMGINESGTNENHQPRAFHSLHPGGAHFALCDGSVHFVSETIDYNFHTVPSAECKNGKWVDSTLERLAAKADGERVGEF
jgi:prepilin-type processing-associated H-X9-DG protein